MVFKTNKKVLMYRSEDIIKFETDVVLTDKKGKIIELKMCEPEYIPDRLL